jgi:uncharacterized protein (DUF58 family)
MRWYRNIIASFRQLHIQQRFFHCLALVVVLFILSFPWPVLEAFAWMILLCLITLTLADFILLFGYSLAVTAERITSKRFSLGDPNEVRVVLKYKGKFPIHVTCYDELPEQFQKRDLTWAITLANDEFYEYMYRVTPTSRGEYTFGFVRALVASNLGILQRNLPLANPLTVPVYPSIIQMKKYEMLAFARISSFEGIKRTRRIGHSYEFEKIRHYAMGDDLRSINWKATSRRNNLMVNQYEDERAQQVYFILDKSRVMQMPFNGLTLLDYSINSILVLANIALQKYDRVGLISFANKLGTVVKSNSTQVQLPKMMQALYAERPKAEESDFDILNFAIKSIVRNRSLLFLFTNFESDYALVRALPMLRKLNATHLLVVVLFENSELRDFSKGSQSYVSDIYTQTIAHRLLQDKKNLVARLNKFGIQTVLAAPEDLSIQTINKYLELKSKGLI